MASEILLKNKDVKNGKSKNVSKRLMGTVVKNSLCIKTDWLLEDLLLHNFEEDGLELVKVSYHSGGKIPKDHKKIGNSELTYAIVDKHIIVPQTTKRVNKKLTFETLKNDINTLYELLYKEDGFDGFLYIDEVWIVDPKKKIMVVFGDKRNIDPESTIDLAGNARTVLDANGIFKTTMDSEKGHWVKHQPPDDLIDDKGRQKIILGDDVRSYSDTIYDSNAFGLVTCTLNKYETQGILYEVKDGTYCSKSDKLT